jgi:hypothetical protein
MSGRVFNLSRWLDNTALIFLSPLQLLSLMTLKEVWLLLEHPSPVPFESHLAQPYVVSMKIACGDG